MHVSMICSGDSCFRRNEIVDIDVPVLNMIQSGFDKLSRRRSLSLSKGNTKITEQWEFIRSSI